MRPTSLFIQRRCHRAGRNPVQQCSVSRGSTASFARNAAGSRHSLCQRWVNAPSPQQLGLQNIQHCAIQGRHRRRNRLARHTAGGRVRRTTCRADRPVQRDQRAPVHPAQRQRQAESFSNAQCFTSLDSVSFAHNGFAPLTLLNGWANAPFRPASRVREYLGRCAPEAPSPRRGQSGPCPARQRPANAERVRSGRPVQRDQRAPSISKPNGVVTVQAETGGVQQCPVFHLARRHIVRPMSIARLVER
jgi:hypothetical protein